MTEDSPTPTHRAFALLPLVLCLSCGLGGSEPSSVRVHEPPEAKPIAVEAVTSTLPSTSQASSNDGIRLVLLLVVDQLRRDRVTADLPGAIGRLAREGRVFSEARLAHAVTATCPGHATIMTARYPGPAGVPGNSFILRETGDSHYCVEDLRPDAVVFGGEGEKGRSPRNLRVASFPAWLKSRHPGSRSMSVAGKDRSAIAMTGKEGDAAWWFQRPIGFTTSRYYTNSLPAWVAEWNGKNPSEDGLFASLPERWEHANHSPGPRGRQDDFVGETRAFRRTSGHPLRRGSLSEIFNQVYASPYLDTLTLDFALELVDREGLGRGESPDLLAVGLSATDIVGHYYGPESHESRDALARLDADLDRFLRQIEARVGSGHLVVVLTADHGVLPLPEWLEATDRSRCPVEGGRASLPAMASRLSAAIERKFGRPHTQAQNWGSEGSGTGWLALAGTGITINRAAARATGQQVEDVAEFVASTLENELVIEEVWTEAEIFESDDPSAALYRNSFDPERSGDLFVEVAPDCLVRPGPEGTTHGSPHLYDRDIPLIFMGPGIDPARVPGRAASVDIVPSLGALLDVPLPDDLDGRRLSLSVDGEAE